MIRRQPGSTLTDTLFPYTSLFRSGALRPGCEGRVDPVLAGHLARPLLLPAVPKGGDMAQGPCACDRLAVAEPGQDIGRRQGLRQLQDRKSTRLNSSH